MSSTIPPTGPAAAGASRDTVAMMRFESEKKSTGVAYLLWFFVGWLGIHRFYLGQTGSGAAMLIIWVLSFVLAFVLIGFVGFFIIGIWWLVDAFLIPGMAQSANERLISRIRG
jgi:TM2 domain-containing membrane protein YozV